MRSMVTSIEGCDDLVGAVLEALGLRQMFNEVVFGLALGIVLGPVGS